MTKKRKAKRTKLDNVNLKLVKRTEPFNSDAPTLRLNYSASVLTIRMKEGPNDV